MIWVFRIVCLTVVMFIGSMAQMDWWYGAIVGLSFGFGLSHFEKAIFGKDEA